MWGENYMFTYTVKVILQQTEHNLHMHRQATFFFYTVAQVSKCMYNRYTCIFAKESDSGQTCHCYENYMYLWTIKWIKFVIWYRSSLFMWYCWRLNVLTKKFFLKSVQPWKRKTKQQFLDRKKVQTGFFWNTYCLHIP